MADQFGMTSCGKCGGAIEANSRFCRHCGAVQGAQSGGTTQPEPKPKNKAAWVIGGGVVLLIAVSQLAGNGAESGSTATSSEAVEAPKLIDPRPSPAADASTWTYSTDKDKLRGADTYLASTTSTNEIQQDAPYSGGTRMTMTVRKHPEWGTDVMLTITEGQLMCSSYDGCSGMVSFDGKKPERVRFSAPEDNASETMFVNGAKAFVAKLKASKSVTIEKTLYQAGAPQFEFRTAGLKWDH